jgi:hypothetical protein
LPQGGLQGPVGVGGQVARQRVGQAGQVPGEDQGAGRGSRPAPLGDVGEKLPYGDDPAAAVADRHGVSVAQSGGGQRRQPRLDGGAVEHGEVGDRRVTPGEKPAEAGQVARDRFDRGRCPGRGGLTAVVQQHGAQWFGHAAVVPTQAWPAPRVRRGRVKDAQVKQHPMRCADHRAVGVAGGGFAVGLGASVQRRGQLVEVGGAQLRQRPAGLDEQPHDDAFGGAAHGVGTVIQLAGRGGERGDLGGQRASAGLGEQPADLAA